MGSQLRRPYGRTHGKDGVAVNLLVDGGRHPEALLALEDGSYFFGRSAGAEGETFGEVVFNTSMVGYQEIVSDPSYAGQLVTLTYPQVGNYGINEIDMQSRELALAGLIVHDMCYQPSNWQSVKSLPGFLAERGIVAIEDVDTRALTLRIREGGAMKAAISTTDLDPASLVTRVQASAAIADHNYVADVSCKEPYVIPAKGECRHKVVAYDCGEKAGIAKRLAAGNYTIALAPIQAEGGSVYQMLQQFGGEASLTGCDDPLYDQLLSESAAQTGSSRCALLAQCERQLLDGCTVVPLLAQQKRLLIADGISGLVFDPFTPVVDVTFAEKN